jgi:hypothetical protein
MEAFAPVMARLRGKEASEYRNSASPSVTRDVITP